MKTEVAQFKTDWVGRKIVPQLNQIPFLSSQMDAVMIKLKRKNSEGKEQFGKDWTDITPQNLINFVPIDQVSTSLNLSISKLETFAETWVAPAKSHEHAASTS